MVQMATYNQLHAAFHLPCLSQCLLCLLAILGILATAPSMAREVLYPGDSLTVGQSLNVSNYVLIMQSDCNLVLYNRSRAIWATSSNRRVSNCSVTMQKDGNLVVYNGATTTVWASKTKRGLGNYALVLQRNGNLVIYGPAIWSSNTMLSKASISPKEAILTSTSHGGVLSVGKSDPTDAVVGGKGNNNC